MQKQKQNVTISRTHMITSTSNLRPWKTISASLLWT